MKSASQTPFQSSVSILKMVWFLLFLIPFHELFFGGAPLRHIVNAGSSMGCPFQATRRFLGHQASSLTMKLPSLSSSFSSSSSLLSFSTMQSMTLSPIRSSESFRFHTELSVATADEKIMTSSSTTSSGENNNNNNSNNKKKGVAPDALEVIVLGLSHHNAGVDIREKLAIPEANWNMASNALTQYASISEAAVLSTCNRFELYMAGQNPYECIRDAMDFLIKRSGGSLDQVTLRKNMFMLSGEDAIWHLLRVSAGLDSLVVGEGQILAQVKKAYEHGIEPDGAAGKVVSRMLNTAVTAGKRVRSETGISKGAVSISSAAVEFSALKVFDDCNVSGGLERANIAIIGAGKMARLLLVHLETQGVKQVMIVNRSPDRVKELEVEFPNLKILYEPMTRMWDIISESDIIYPSTASTTTIIDPEPLAKALQKRTRMGGIQFVDISVPRNVHPDCANVPNVKSYNVDDLKLVVEKNTAKRKREMLEAENILRDEQSKYRLWQQSLGAIPTIAKLQEKAENLRVEELSKASKKLANLSAKDLEAVDRLSKGIVAKLLHGPMSHLRQQKEADATRAAIHQVQQAFQLEH